MKRRWEYKFVHEGNHDTFLAALNKCGADGWELVYIDEDEGNFRAYFKRFYDHA